MPRRSRVALCAPPGHGKTSLIKNLLIRSRSDKDPWAAVVVITGVGDFCKEWDKVEHTKTDFATADEKWWADMSKQHSGKPIACIVDDMNYADLSPKERSNAYKLMQFVCTHKEITAYHRVLGNNSQFTENFTSIPPSVGAIFVALRDNKHDINVNSETFKLGGDSTYGFSRFSMQLGSLILAQPAYELNMSDRSVARAYADYLSAVGAGPSSDRGQSMTEWCSTLGPILAFRVLQEPGSYASTLTLRFNLKNALIDAAAATPYKGSPELVCIK